MIKIFIYDSQKDYLQIVKEIIHKKIIFSDIPIKIESATTKHQEILSKIDPKIKNVYLIDIYQKNSSYLGLKLAHDIRKIDPNAFIIFITEHLELVMITFEQKLEILDFILKTNDIDIVKSRLESNIDAIIQKFKIEQNMDVELKIEFKSDYEKINIFIHELLLLEIIGNHKIKVTSKYHSFECNGSLNKFEKGLPNYLIKCNRSTIINTKEIKKISIKEEFIELSNGIKIICSKFQLKKFNNLLNNNIIPNTI